MTHNINLDGAKLHQDPSCIRCGEHKEQEIVDNKVVMYGKDCKVTVSMENCGEGAKDEMPPKHTPPEMVSVKSNVDNVKIKRTSKHYLVQIKVSRKFTYEKALREYSGDCMLAWQDVLSDHLSQIEF